MVYALVSNAEGVLPLLQEQDMQEQALIQQVPTGDRLPPGRVSRMVWVIFFGRSLCVFGAFGAFDVSSTLGNLGDLGDLDDLDDLNDLGISRVMTELVRSMMDRPQAAGSVGVDGILVPWRSGRKSRLHDDSVGIGLRSC